MQPVKTNTIGSVLTQLTNMFSASPSARLDAEVLTGFACQLSREQLVTRDNSEISPAEYDALQQLALRRQAGEPVAHITGQREFYSLPLTISKHTLIPRPETELLVDLVLQQIPENKAMRILELGTGSGAIALAIGKHRPRCTIIATDISGKALEIAAGNARNLSISNIAFLQGDWFDCPGSGQLQLDPFDIVVSNPPYIAANDPHLVEGDVRFEPAAALVAGQDGLDDIRNIASQAPQYLLPGGLLLLEHGASQAKDLNSILGKAGGRNISCFQDLAGLDRVSSCTF